jgi:hypothetical protein
VRRLAAAAGLAVVVLLGVAPSAWAHAELVASDPADGARLATAPQRIELTFTEPIDPDGAVIFVSCANRSYWSVGSITAKDDSLTMPVTPAGRAGPCTVNYYVSSADGAPVRGEVGFTLTKDVPASGKPATTSTPAAPDPDPITGASADSGGGLPAWAWVLMAAAALGLVAGAVAGVLLRAGRRKRQ